MAYLRNDGLFLGEGVRNVMIIIFTNIRLKKEKLGGTMLITPTNPDLDTDLHLGTRFMGVVEGIFSLGGGMKSLTVVVNQVIL